MDSYYGALPAHAGMWRAAEDTKSDLLGRLAVVPMVLEARSLDVTPNMIEIFRRAKANEAVAALEIIYRKEVSHVAYGSKWFNFLCGAQSQVHKYEGEEEERSNSINSQRLARHCGLCLTETGRAAQGRRASLFYTY